MLRLLIRSWLAEIFPLTIIPSPSYDLDEADFWAKLDDVWYPMGDVQNFKFRRPDIKSWSYYRGCVKFEFNAKSDNWRLFYDRICTNKPMPMPIAVKANGSTYFLPETYLTDMAISPQFYPNAPTSTSILIKFIWNPEADLDVEIRDVNIPCVA